MLNISFILTMLVLTFLVSQVKSTMSDGSVYYPVLETVICLVATIGCAANILAQ